VQLLFAKSWQICLRRRGVLPAGLAFAAGWALALGRVACGAMPPEPAFLWLYEQPVPLAHMPACQAKHGKIAFSAVARGTETALLLLLALFLTCAFVDEVVVVEAKVVASATARFEVDIGFEFAEVAVSATARFEVDMVVEFEVAEVAVCNQRSSQSDIGTRRQRSESNCDASGELLFIISYCNR